MGRIHASEDPLSVEICDGEVVLISRDGPFGISLTPSAAAATAEQLAAAAATVLARQASQVGAIRD